MKLKKGDKVIPLWWFPLFTIDKIVGKPFGNNVDVEKNYIKLKINMMKYYFGKDDIVKYDKNKSYAEYRRDYYEIIKRYLLK
ncbi:MAG TPA: hypothetical protein DCR71_01335 [Dehalococcoidia bacterium]|nr:hypothetical protein [Dehalococcoidia bacterium]